MEETEASGTFVYLILEDLFLHVKEFNREKGRQRKSKVFSACWLTPQRAQQPGLGQATPKSTELYLCLLCGWQGPKYLDHILCPFLVPI